MKEALLQEVWKQAPGLEGHLCYLAFAGSHSYGTSTDASDIDLRGIAFAPEEAVFGLQAYEQTMLVQPDTVVYGLNKYVRLAVKGNPNIVEMLYVEPKHVLYASDAGEELRSHRGLFLSRRLYHSYGGYAIRNLRKLARIREQYDAKDAHHLIRLLQMGRELLETGELQVLRPNAEELKSIKRGEWSAEDLLAYAEDLFAKMTSAWETSSLPDDVDVDAVQRLTIRLNRAFYG
ncbi:DNA polymerase beta superfamily protein [Brevibacillus brevis]|uniref:Nucleotidyltransferase domain-containing protein n=1 Tax=Brevibacillus brevis TaxID=1393 RepID=A0ABY9T448_BREBE|nr:nucleotidyltransferase domain-containing protein [Brevibacillus brevis]WNC14016.1 nucleotidyltransferase domain-containing protein [Brevibacillus brevis]